MGKKRKQRVQQEERVADTDSSDEDVNIFTDEINDFTQARNKIRIDNRKEASSEEEEIFGLVGSSDDDSDEEINQWSRQLKQAKLQATLDKNKEEPEIQERSYHRDRKDFYGSGLKHKPKTTQHDEDDEWMLEAEEIERLQKKMDEDMDDDDFFVPGLKKKSTQPESTKLEVKSSLSEKERKQLQSQHHPEMEPLREELNKCLSIVEKIKGFKGWRLQSMDTVFRMYGAQIAFYLHLLEAGEDTRGHPVLARLLSWKKLAKVYEGFPDEWMEASESEGEGAERLGEDRPHRPVYDDSEEGEDDEDENMADEEGEDTLTNRPVTYLIEKNKPKKKSKPNNPRVNHREKFRKAKIRRKGKIRDYRPEMDKYRGEMSGIRASLVRSTKYK